MHANKGTVENAGLNVELSNIIDNSACVSNSEKCPLEIVNPIVDYHTLTDIVGSLYPSRINQYLIFKAMSMHTNRIKSKQAFKLVLSMIDSSSISFNNFVIRSIILLCIKVYARRIQSCSVRAD